MDVLARAGEALMRGSWVGARELFETSMSIEETREALEGLGVAASWLDDTEKAADARERAYRGFRKRGASLEAARVAMTLGMMHLGFMDAPNIAQGWLRRAGHILEDLETTPVHGWVALGEGFIAAIWDKDLHKALEAGRGDRAFHEGHPSGDDGDRPVRPLHGLRREGQGRDAAPR